MGLTFVIVLVFAALFGVLVNRLSLLSQLSQQGHTTPQQKLIDEVDALLPQLQCGQCSYPGCRPYAEAIINRDERIDLCPPGGQATVTQLANFLQVDSPQQLNFAADAVPTVAVIDPQQCIGCTLCLPVCPTDAIVGSRQHLHRVVTDNCVGCGLCVAPCPVDCIQMQPLKSLSPLHPPLQA